MINQIAERLPVLGAFCGVSVVPDVVSNIATVATNHTTLIFQIIIACIALVSEYLRFLQRKKQEKNNSKF